MRNIDKTILGIRINKIRVNRKETLEEFAEQIRKATNFKIKTTKSNVSKWEKGLNIPNDITLNAIAELGNVSIEYLLEGSTDLAGNQIEISELANYDYEITAKSKLQNKKSELPFFYFVVKFFLNDDFKAAIIRGFPVITDGGLIKEFYFEDCHNKYDIGKFYLLNKDFDSKLGITDIQNDVIDINLYFSAKENVFIDIKEPLLNSLFEFVTQNDKSLKSVSKPKLFFIDRTSKITEVLKEVQ